MSTGCLSRLRFFASIATLAIAACHSGGGGGSPPVQPAPQPPPTVLSGAGSASAAGVLPTIESPFVSSADTEDDYLLTRIVVVLAQGATVDQVNAAARAVGATRIVTSANGSPLIVLEVPRQADPGASIQLARTLGAQPGVALAFAARTQAAQVLPEAQPGVPVSTDALNHLLATRFPEAWNARGAEDSGCLPRQVPVYVLDEFGPVESSFLLLMNDSDFDSSAEVASAASGHGYDVSLVLAGAFDAKVPTGAVPFADCTMLHPIEAAERDSVTQIEALVATLQAEPGHFVLNNSMVDSEPRLCGPNRNERCTATNASTAQASDLREDLMARIAEGTYLAQRLGTLNASERMLITVSAGNVIDVDDDFFAQRYRGFRDTRLNNMFAIATHLADIDALLQDPDLWTSNDPATPANIAFDSTALAQLHVLLSGFGPVAPLDASTLMIVDSGSPRTADSWAETADDVAPSAFDYLGANVRAVAEGVPLRGGAALGSGTSLAAPQIAGLAAYLWTLSDDLAAQPTSATVAQILRTARPPAPGSVGLLAVPLADAYQAVLTLDKPNGPRKVRLALVDVNDDGSFDALDLEPFVTAYQLSNPNRPTIPAARDFSRFDLNGDGYTGGIITAAFDLDVGGVDADGHPTINAVDEQVEGYPITFNEAALSDLQILCFYAYSSLYATDNGGQNDQARTSLLGPDNCAGARLNTLLPEQISSSTTLTTTVEVPLGNGTFGPAPNMLVELTPTCATVSPAGGQRTDANGRVTATVTPADGCSSVSVQVVARADPGTSPLAQQVVTSTVALGQSTFGLVGIDQSPGGPPGVLRATFADVANGAVINRAQFTAPVSDLAGFMSRVESMLAAVTKIGAFSIALTDPNLGSIALDLPGIQVGDLEAASSCGSTLTVRVGDVRTDSTVNPFTSGNVGVGGCGTVNVSTGAVSGAVLVAGTGLTASISSSSTAGGIDTRDGLKSSTVSFTVGTTRVFNVINALDSTVSLQGIVTQAVALQGDKNVTFGSDIVSNGLTGDLFIDSNSFGAQSPLSVLDVGSIGGNLTITNNVGFTDRQAQDFANAQSVAGTKTISNNVSQ